MKVRCLLIGVVVLFVACMLTASSYARIDPKTVTGVWLFDEGNGNIAKDSSGKGNDGKLIGKSKWVDGKFGKALDFDSVDDWVDCGDKPEFNITGNLTIAALVKFSNSFRSFLVGKGALASGNDSTYFLGTGSASSWLFGVGDGATYQHTVANVVEPVGVWRHVAGVKSGTTFTIYIDGVSNNSSTITLKPFQNDASLVIGRWAVNDTSYPFKGIIDEVALFNVPLAEQDIQTLMNKGLKESLSLTAIDLSGKLTTTWANIKAR